MTSRTKTCFVPAALFLVFGLMTVRSAGAQWLPRNAVRSAEKLPDGALITLETGYLRLTVCSPSVVHVVYSIEREPKRHEDFLVVKNQWPPAPFEFQDGGQKLVSLSTSQLKIAVMKEDGSMIFYDSAGRKLTQENTRTLTPVEVNGEKTYRAERFGGFFRTFA